MKAHYLKHYSTPEEIVDILCERGMRIEDKDKAMKYLKNISYQRLIPYIIPFYQLPKDKLKFKKDTTFNKALSLYRFDKKLRILLFNEIEKIEIAIRCVLGGVGCEILDDDYWITNIQYYNDRGKFESTMKIVDKELSDSKEDVIIHFRSNYLEAYPPVWMITEVLSFGNLNYIYTNINNTQVRKAVSDYFGIKPKVFTSWLTTLANLRNMCCHHARIWNRDFDIRPIIPHSLSNKWINTTNLDSSRLYFRVCIIKYFLNVISPNSDMTRKLTSLFQNYRQIDLLAMGFPFNWQNEPLWQD